VTPVRNKAFKNPAPEAFPFPSQSRE